VELHGQVDDGWGKVADVLRESFAIGHEIGAGLCIYVDGRSVIDVWGGVADRRSGRPWARDTVVVVFSCAKGATAICANMLVERGDLDLDAPVSSYWPEFGAAGKEQMPVRWLLTHQAALHVVDRVLTFQELCSWEPLVRALEAQEPSFAPGGEHIYHAITYGHLVGEVIRRVAGKTVGQLFGEEIARPLGLRSYIGLPLDPELDIAHVTPGPPPPPEFADAIAGLEGPEAWWVRSLTLGEALPLALVTDEGGGLNAREALAAEIPAGNLVSDARSLARMYAATIGTVDGVRLLRADTVQAAATRQTRSAFGMPAGSEELALHFGLGFQVPSATAPLLGPTSFGHGGASGAVALADPDSGVSVGYVRNNMWGIRGPAGEDVRARLLLEAVRSCL